ncbi:F510_1955 family glycosylhydrolase [Neobacillus pocheonensis]|uniref:F510_1955 family glycosylhydrolase n=1 Tax=Neobacillus pocheonensis TaxID=363869 RepID=UPI003D2AB60D
MKIQKKVLLIILTGILLIAAGCSSEQPKKSVQKNETVNKIKYGIVEAKSLKIENIRGIGYPGNDNGLYVASDQGLKLFKDSKWYETTTNKHEYIGFQALDKGFVTSGIPQKGTGYKNPLGLVQSVDKGESIKKLAYYGDLNFYFMAASFSGDAIYVISEQPHGELSQGVNYTKDNGQTWKKSAFKNFNADSLGMMSVNPTNGDIMAMATRSGIYYSNDNGNTMKLITAPIMVTALTFNGDSLLFSSVENNSILLKKENTSSGEQADIAIPFLDYDNPITYLSVNPKNENQIAFTTYRNDLYESKDGGKTWNMLLKDGKKELE